MRTRTLPLPRSPYGPGTHVVEYDAPELGHLPGGWSRIKGPWPRTTCEQYVATQNRIWQGTQRYRIVEHGADD